MLLILSKYILLLLIAGDCLVIMHQPGFALKKNETFSQTHWLYSNWTSWLVATDQGLINSYQLI